MDLENIYRQIASCFTNANGNCILFISDIEHETLKDCVKRNGWNYLPYIIANEDDMFRVFNELCFLNPEISTYDQMISQHLTDASQINTIPTHKCDGLAFRVLKVLDKLGKYVIHISPINNLVSQRNLLRVLNNICQNKCLQNLKFVVVSTTKEYALYSEYFNYFERKQINKIKGMKEIFISYSWKEPSNHIVENDIVPALKNNNIPIVLDKNDCDYGMNIREFEEMIGRGERILAVVSKAYVHSIQCMYEMACIFEEGNVMDRLSLVFIEDFDRNDDQFYVDVVNFWHTLLQDKIKYSRETPAPANESFLNDIKYINRIINHVSSFWTSLKSINTLTLTELGRNGFEKLVRSLGHDTSTPIMDTNITPLSTGTTMNNQISITGAHAQININKGNTMNVYNNVAANEDMFEIINDVLKTKYSINGTSKNIKPVEIVRDICMLFKNLVENNRMSEIYYRKGRVPDEPDWQYLLYTIAITYIKACNCNLHVSREDNPGPGEIDMHFTRGSEVNIVIEMKVSGNGLIEHGYKEQLRGYMQAEGASQGFYIIVEQDDQHSTEIENIKNFAEKSKAEGADYAPEVIIVNGRKQPSASQKSYIAPRN